MSFTARLMPTASITLNPKPVMKTTAPKKLHVIKSGDKLHSLRHKDTSLLAFLQYEAANRHRDYLWRSYEATGSLFQGTLDDDQCLQFHAIQEAKPVNSDGAVDLKVDHIFFHEIRSICLKNIVSLVIVTSISDIDLRHCTYHCHKYEPRLTHTQMAGLLEENWNEGSTDI